MPHADITVHGVKGNSTVRLYYIAAVEEEWDYMPR